MTSGPGARRPLLRAAILSHDPPSPGQSLFARPDTGPTTPQRFGYLVRRGAALVGVSPPAAARPLYGINPATPFSAAVATRSFVTTTDISCGESLTSRAASH